MEKLNLHMLLHAGEAKMMCATFNHMDFRDISVFQTNGTGLSFILASSDGESFGDLRIHGISC
jgi:hypothetical protein